MRTLRQHAVAKLLDGETTLAEVTRVTQADLLAEAPAEPVMAE